MTSHGNYDLRWTNKDCRRWGAQAGKTDKGEPGPLSKGMQVEGTSAVWKRLQNWTHIQEMVRGKEGRKEALTLKCSRQRSHVFDFIGNVTNCHTLSSITYILLIQRLHFKWVNGPCKGCLFPLNRSEINLSLSGDFFNTHTYVWKVVTTS